MDWMPRLRTFPALLAATAFVGCTTDIPSDPSADGGGPQDAGPPSIDARVDGAALDAFMVPSDGGLDGPLDPPDAGARVREIRLAHLMAGGPEMHVCLETGGAWNLITRNAVTGTTSAIDFGDVSGYASTLLPAGPLRFTVYDAALVGGPCPVDTSVAMIDQTLDGTALASDHPFTIAITGLPAGGGESSPELVVFDDDNSAPAITGEVRLRLVNAVPNLPADEGSVVDLCFDADPSDGTPPVQLVDQISFEEASAYVERAPILAGALSIHAHVPDMAECTKMLARVVVPIPASPGSPDDHTATLRADTTNTIWFLGNATIVTPGVGCTTHADCVSAGPPGVFCGDGALCSHRLLPSISATDDTGSAP